MDNRTALSQQIYILFVQKGRHSPHSGHSD